MRVLRRVSGVDGADQGPDRIIFLERIEPACGGEDVDTARLIRRIQGGERRLYHEIYLRYFDRVYVYLRTVLRDASEAEDAAQQTFLQALEALPRFDPSRAPFRAWLFVIARNYALNRFARHSHADACDPEELTRLQEAEARDIDESAAWLLDRRLVHEIERLPVSQREVLVLHTILDMPFDAIAHRLGRRRDNVRGLHSRATRSLAARLRAGGHT